MKTEKTSAKNSLVKDLMSRKGFPPVSILPLWQRIYQQFIIRSQRWGLPSNTCMALVHLYRHPEDSEPAAIAEANIIPRQTATFILDTLERKKLAARRPHPNDRRRKRVQLTTKGHRVAEEMFKDLIRFEATALRAIEPSKVNELCTILDSYADALAAQNASETKS